MRPHGVGYPVCPMLPITNGDSVASTLRRAGLPGEVAVTADVLHEGPCLTGASPAEWREARARHLARAGHASYDEALQSLVEADAALDSAGSHDEVVLWFEHDLFDQLLLVRALAHLGRAGLAGRTRLICIGSHPAFTRFVGLGQLSAAQLAALFPGRAAVTDAQVALAAETWRRFGADDPSGFAALAGEGTPDLPFLGAAVRRQLEEFPSVRNGLSRAQHQALAAVAAGAADLATAFLSTQEMEEAAFMGDTVFFGLARELADAPLPLLQLDGANTQGLPGRQRVALTPLGREVLAGHADFATLNGLDRWIGGVHLRGRTPRWRWDDVRARLTDGKQ